MLERGRTDSVRGGSFEESRGLSSGVSEGRSPRARPVEGAGARLQLIHRSGEAARR